MNSTFTSTLPRNNNNKCPSLNSALTSFQKSKKYLQCTYDSSFITTSRQVNEYIEAFGRDENYENEIMPSFCSLQTSSCPTDITTGNPMSSCSNFVETGESGTLCREWVNCVGSNSDLVKQNYCMNNNTPDCKCLNRNTNSLYTSLSSSLPNIPDSCWWTPCADTFPYLVTTDLLNPTCPSNTCTQVNNAIRSSSVPIGNNAGFINCPIPTSLTPSPILIENNMNNPMTLPPQNTPVEPKQQNLIYFIIIAVVIIAVILLIIFALVYFTRRKKEKEEFDKIKKDIKMEIPILLSEVNQIPYNNSSNVTTILS